MNDQIREAMTLMSKLTLDQIESAMATGIATTASLKITDILDSPGPDFSAQDIDGLYDAWQPEQHAHLLKLMPALYLRQQASYTRIEQILQSRSPKAYDLYKVYPDGKRGWIEVPQTTNLKDFTLTSFDEDSLEKSLKSYEAILKASRKIGIPKTPADLAKENVKADTLMKTALLRRAASSAGINLTITALFDIRLLIDGDVKAYLVKIGVSGLYGGAVSGCSAWIEHPFFGNGAVLGVIVGSAFGVVSLACTGDWARFGKNVGLNIVGSVGGWAGAQAGAWGGTAVGGPIGGVIGAIVGGFAGGIAGRWMATATTNLAEETDVEIDGYYERVKEQWEKIGIQPDPSLSRREFVKAVLKQGSDPNSKAVLVQMTGSMAADVKTLQDSLIGWRDGNPDGFEEFLKRLREAVASRE